MSDLIFVKTINGYMRTVPENSSEKFIWDTLTNEVNRRWWHRLCYWVVCKWLVHLPSKLIVVYGYSNEIGSYAITFCVLCRKKMLVCDRKGD